ncbi:MULTISPECIES: bacillithiol system redox-active protein YtxJ [Bacillaceae]|uniref:bacillithiol system redox-active protein YtxJ n=1 Tax=Bacillaceae TaxID=186817 RepID=UPI00101B6636|nr:bacillithiol system redox-active protein YtxJ [Ectobacillus funiculus]
MEIKKLTSIDEMNQFVQQSGKHLLFKHSTTCPISAQAHEEFQAFVKDTNTSAAIVLVIEDRPVSNQIAEQFGIKHESPQVFLLEDGQVRWNTSHWKITKEALKEAVGE